MDAVVSRLRGAGCVFAEEEAALLRAEATSAAHLADLLERRVSGQPLETVLGWARFCGLRIRVAPGVFVPRTRSQVLVAAALSLLPDGDPVVLDLCCGSGAIGAAVLAARPSARVYAGDVDPVAVACARTNLPPERVFAGDLFAALPPALRGRLDLVVVNAPYVPTAAIAALPPEAREHEARVALDGGADGLDLHRRLAREVSPWLTGDGAVVVEAGVAQAPISASLFGAAGFRTRVVRDDEIDGTAVLATRGRVFPAA